MTHEEFIQIKDNLIVEYREELEDIVLDACKKQTPENPVLNRYKNLECPTCHWYISDTWNGQDRYPPFCENCGQAIKWERK